MPDQAQGTQARGAREFEYRIPDPRARTLGRILAERAAATPDRTCLIWKGAERFTFRELDDAVNRAATGLALRGVGHGDRVVVMSGNCPEFVFLIFALARVGAVIVTVNVHARGAQLEHMLTNSQPTLVVVEPDNVERVLEASAGLAPAPGVVVLGDADAGAHERVTASSELFDQPPYQEHPEVQHSDLAQILYTSGTTGPSKGVMITNHQAYAFADYVSQAMEMTEDDVYYTCLPLFHVNAQLSVLAVVLTGGCLALYEKFSASAFWGQVRDVNATAVSLFGAMAYILYKQPPEDDRPTALRVCWAFPAPYDILDDFERRYGFRVLTAYASTEANFVAIGGLRDDLPQGAAGRVHPRFEVKVVDADDQEVPSGTTGEIVTRPRDPFTMMLGYYRMPETTAEVFQNLWYHTGDAGRLDDDGYLYFVDRIKDVIRRRGENISSYEVEQAITSHPGVAECAAVAVRSELSEDEVMAVIVLREGTTLEPAEIVAWCSERMAYFMVPRFIRIVLELPKTPTGKVEKYQLRSSAPADGVWDAQAATG
jgi:crotonobetaine/carnitine-CoA ligase